MNRIIFVVAAVLILVSCSEKKETVIKSDLEIKMDKIAEDYVKLVLNIGQYDADFVDAYYGPAEWRADLQTNLSFNSTAFKNLSRKTDELLNESRIFRRL